MIICHWPSRISKKQKSSRRQFACKVMGIIHSYAMMAKNIEIKTIVEEEFDLLCNKNELRQVLINILKNGIEAMKDGGTLTLRVYKDSRYGIFEVRDTGVGMTKEELKQLGMPYFTRKEKGTGIGLTVCWQIISRMNGKIEVESEKGKGNGFPHQSAFGEGRRVRQLKAGADMFRKLCL